MSNREVQGKHWGIILQNQVEPVEQEKIISFMKTLPLEEWVFQKELGEEKEGEHYQMYINCTTKKRQAQIIDMFMKIMPCREAISARKVVKKDAIIKYCTKCETRVEGPWASHETLLPPEKLEDPMEGLEPYEWQKRIIDLCKTKPDKRKIHWFWEEKGNIGKSSLTKHLGMKHGVVRIGAATAKDIFYYITSLKVIPKAIVLDFPRTTRISIEMCTAIEELKNGYIFSPKYESGSLMFNTPTIIVLANQAPPEGIWSEDRYDVHRIEQEWSKKDLELL